MFDVVKFGKTLLELLDHRPVVTQPAMIEDFAHVVHECSAAADVGEVHVQWLFKGRISAIDGDILHIKDRLHVKVNGFVESQKTVKHRGCKLICASSSSQLAFYI